MRFSLTREALLKPLQAIAGVVERRQTMPILGNVLLQVTETSLSITGSDSEVELVGHIPLVDAEPGSITVPGRKFLDICRALPEAAVVEIVLDDERVKLRSGRSRYTLATLPAAEFPNVEPLTNATSLTIPQKTLRELVSKTHFAMAVSDVRYFLIGVLLEIATNKLVTCATDGHRLALCQVTTDIVSPQEMQVIVPRKGVGELLKLLEDSETEVEMLVATNHIQVRLEDVTFTSKLIDGRFPDYQRVIPLDANKVIVVNRKEMLQALHRAAVIFSEKGRGIQLVINPERLRVLAVNLEQERAEEELVIDYNGESIEIGFNVSYLLDIFEAITAEEVAMALSHPNNSALIYGVSQEYCQYVVMPVMI